VINLVYSKQDSNKDKKLHEPDEQSQRSQLVTVVEKKKGKEEEMQLAREELERLKEHLKVLQLDVKKLSTQLSQV
jgi:geranylgeranyl pyrophosphate synthase